jgi:hypothetical protein
MTGSGRGIHVLLLAMTIAGVGCDDTTSATTLPVTDAGADARSLDAGDWTTEEKFCATRPALQFCEDFYDAPLPGHFGTMVGEGAFAIDATVSRSLPRSLKVTADPARGASIAARLEKSFPAGKKLRGFAIVRVGARASNDGGTLKLMAMRFALADGGRYEISILTETNGAWSVHEERVGPGTPPQPAPAIESFPASRPLAPNEWTSIRFEVDFDGQGGGTLNVRVGADAAVEAVKLTPPTEPLAPTFVLGLDGTAPATAWSVNFDTVTFSVD